MKRGRGKGGSERGKKERACKFNNKAMSKKLGSFFKKKFLKYVNPLWRGNVSDDEGKFPSYKLRG